MSRAGIMDHPILFSADMIRVILRDCGWRPKPDPDRPYKAMTRRTQGLAKINAAPDTFRFVDWTPPFSDGVSRAVFDGAAGAYYVRPPYGMPGGRLWVREGWDFVGWDADADARQIMISYAADGAQRLASAPADWNPTVYNYQRWRPSIHMPRFAARLLLTSGPIRVERLQDITDADAMAEGLRRIPHKTDFAYTWKNDDPNGYASPRGAFSALWDNLNAARGLGCERNPWVWVVEFERLQP